MRNKSAWSAYDGFLADERIAWTQEPADLEFAWKKLSAGMQPSPKLWTDACLAAFAITGGYQLLTTDKAFKQFKGLNLLILS